MTRMRDRLVQRDTFLASSRWQARGTRATRHGLTSPWGRVVFGFCQALELLWRVALLVRDQATVSVSPNHRTGSALGRARTRQVVGLEQIVAVGAADAPRRSAIVAIFFSCRKTRSAGVRSWVRSVSGEPVLSCSAAERISMSLHASSPNF